MGSRNNKTIREEKKMTKLKGKLRKKTKSTQVNSTNLPLAI
jgi:hypothetical protein